jgi:hypothetical protein
VLYGYLQSLGILINFVQIFDRDLLFLFVILAIFKEYKPFSICIVEIEPTDWLAIIVI